MDEVRERGGSVHPHPEFLIVLSSKFEMLFWIDAKAVALDQPFDIQANTA
jgi:hypothetical protein